MEFLVDVRYIENVQHDDNNQRSKKRTKNPKLSRDSIADIFVIRQSIHAKLIFTLGLFNQLTR
uniref:Uncharacterized protein n=1 Tax=Romanomermis culicivorax TaxID=13658 RepID=A0A915JW46_ROMCU